MPREKYVPKGTSLVEARKFVLLFDDDLLVPREVSHLGLLLINKTHHEVALLLCLHCRKAPSAGHCARGTARGTSNLDYLRRLLSF